jgi:hypothetical protein
VLNPARVSGRTVAAAEGVAGGIFRKAGVEISWVDCATPEACRGEPGPAEFWLHLLDKRPVTLSGDGMGFALLTHAPHNEGSYAAVSWQAIDRLVDSMEVDAVPVLGAAMAHELGHLLLGSQAHSRDGVMAAHLRTLQLAQAARGELRFSEVQAEAIRAEIRRRRG